MTDTREHHLIGCTSPLGPGRFQRDSTCELYEQAHNDYFQGGQEEAYILMFSVAFYVADGWDEMWPYTDMPDWLKPRYTT